MLKFVLPFLFFLVCWDMCVCAYQTLSIVFRNCNFI